MCRCPYMWIGKYQHHAYGSAAPLPHQKKPSYGTKVEEPPVVEVYTRHTSSQEVFICKKSLRRQTFCLSVWYSCLVLPTACAQPEGSGGMHCRSIWKIDNATYAKKCRGSVPLRSDIEETLLNCQQTFDSNGPERRIYVHPRASRERRHELTRKETHAITSRTQLHYSCTTCMSLRTCMSLSCDRLCGLEQTDITAHVVDLLCNCANHTYI